MSTSTAIDLQGYEPWQAAAEAVAQAQGTVLILGDLDVGKTAFLRLAANIAVKSGRSVAILDADLGQSEIGPPTCLGWATPTQEFDSLLDLRPAGLAFVGSTSPRGRLAEYMVALDAALQGVKAAEPDVVFVDTMGFVHGPGALRLRHAEMQMLRPDHVVVLERAGECEAVARFAQIVLRARVDRLQVPDFMGRKPASIRAQRRAARFVRYFQGAQMRTLRFEDFAVCGGWLNTGRPLEPHVLRAMAGELGVTVLHAELTGRDLGVVVNALPAQGRSLDTIREQFRTESITLSVASRLKHLVVGLSNGHGFLGIGTVEYINYRSRLLQVHTPVRNVEAVRLVAFGRLRVMWDGRELGVLEAGEI
ncbi:MAG: Clp1/GlmU family protein [Chthonomonadales bacterium]